VLAEALENETTRRCLISSFKRTNYHASPLSLPPWLVPCRWWYAPGSDTMLSPFIMGPNLLTGGLAAVTRM
jgi:hypothetical protein